MSLSRDTFLHKKWGACSVLGEYFVHTQLFKDCGNLITFWDTDYLQDLSQIPRWLVSEKFLMGGDIRSWQKEK